MTTRDDIYNIAEQAARDAWDDATEYAAAPRAIVDAILPQITDAEQMVDVPAGSIIAFAVMSSTPGKNAACIMEWDGIRLNGDVRIDKIPQIPEKVIAMYGPLTVVWTP